MSNFFGESSARIKMMKERTLNSMPTISSERAKIVTKSYMENEDKPAVLKRAISFKDVLEQMTIYIAPGELLVGNHAEKIKYTPIFPEYVMDWVIDELDEMAKRPGDRFEVPEDVKEDLRKLAPYWKGKTVTDRAYAIMLPETRELFEAGVIKAAGSIQSGDAHLAINNKKLLEIGLIGFKKEVEEKIASLNLGDYRELKQLQFLNACLIVLDATMAFF